LHQRVMKMITFALNSLNFCVEINYPSSIVRIILFGVLEIFVKFSYNQSSAIFN
jgi:hypothetical protein